MSKRCVSSASLTRSGLGSDLSRSVLKDYMPQAKKTLKEGKDVELHPTNRGALQENGLHSFPHTYSFSSYSSPAAFSPPCPHLLAVVLSHPTVLLQDLPSSKVDGDFFGKAGGMAQLLQLLLSLL